ncbi:MAG TPA: hypothetical protein VKN35_00840 [Xanthomonadales bacterium]|nr:hypothetical protein [Xanthomonadales bacterium]
MSFFEELKRRNVVRMAVLYTVASWLILQIADVLFENLDVPAWAFRLVLGLLALGFPLALIFSWVFEITPEGIKREKEIDRHQSITHETGRKLNITIVLLLVLAIGGLIADRLIPEHSPAAQNGALITGETASVPVSAPGTTAAPASAASELSIAVLPFVNMSGDADNEYFSDGLSEELLNTLVQIRDLKVTGRTSSFAFKGQNLDLREIGERLNVANVLEGSVRKAANRVRITAQLVKTDDGYHLWSETFDRELHDIFAIQQEIAEKVAQALSVTLLGEAKEAPGGTHNADAYQAYLRGIHVFRRAPDDLESLATARAYFEQANALDPDYLAPIFGMYQYWERVNRNGFVDLAVSQAGAETVAGQIRLIAPESTEALLTQARVSLRTNKRAESLELYRKALERDPGSVETNMWYGSVLFFNNQREEGLAFARKALELDPLSLEAVSRLAGMETHQGNCEIAKSLRERALEIEPDYGRVNGYVGYCLLAFENHPSEAMTWLDKEPLEWMRRAGRAIALHQLGREDEAQAEVDLMMDDYADTAAFQYAQVYSQWGEKEKALEWLQTAIAVGDPGTLNIKVDPFLEPLHQEPWYQELLIQVGFEPALIESNQP